MWTYRRLDEPDFDEERLLEQGQGVPPGEGAELAKPGGLRIKRCSKRKVWFAVSVGTLHENFFSKASITGSVVSKKAGEKTTKLALATALIGTSNQGQSRA